MVKGKKKTIEATDKSTGNIRTSHLSCIGNICFTDEGFVISVAEGASVECAKEIAKKIFNGKSKVTFEVNPEPEASDE